MDGWVASIRRGSSGSKAAYTSTLDELVRGGQLKSSTLLTVEGLGWSYELDSDRDSFHLDS